MKNLFPSAARIDGAGRSRQKKQRASVVWFTGLSGSGKSTLAFSADEALIERGYHTYVLDGDNIRSGLNSDLGFTDADRHENIRRLAEVARLFADAGLIVFVASISPFVSDRQFARSLLPPTDFVEVYVNAPFAVCRARDPKGLYAKEKAGGVPRFTGVTSAYEPPQNPELILMTAEENEKQSLAMLLGYLEDSGRLRRD